MSGSCMSSPQGGREGDISEGGIWIAHCFELMMSLVGLSV